MLPLPYAGVVEDLFEQVRGGVHDGVERFGHELGRPVVTDGAGQLNPCLRGDVNLRHARAKYARLLGKVRHD